MDEDQDDTISFGVETRQHGEGEMTLGVEQARDWVDQIEDQLENGPGGVVRIRTVQPDGMPLTFELPPLVAEDLKDDIKEELEGGDE